MIELLVVIVILGILMAVAVPTFLRQQTKAQDSKTEQQLSSAYRAIRSGLAEFNNQYPSVASVVSVIAQSEPELTVTSGSCNGSASDRQVVVDNVTSTPSKLNLYAKSSSGSWWNLSAPSAGAAVFTKLGTCAGPLSTGTLTVNGNEITDTTRAADVQGDGASASSSYGIWEPTTNLVPHGGFEDASSGWAGNDAHSQVVADRTRAKFGSSSLKVTVDSGGVSNVSGANSNLTVTTVAGTKYSYSIWLYTQESGLQVQIQLTDNIDQGLTGPTVTLPAGVWTRLSDAQTTDSHTSRALRVNLVSAGAHTFWVDGGQVETKPYPTPYVDTNGSTASRGGAHVTAAASALSETQGWYALRLQMGYPSSQNPNWQAFFAWIAGSGATENQVAMLTQTPSSSWEIDNRRNGTFSDVVSSADPFSVGDERTIVVSWTNSQIGLSVAGSAFKTTARLGSVGGTALPATFDIGSFAANGGYGDSNVVWFACGTGTLTDSDAAQINSFGDNDPTSQDFPAAAQATLAWAADNSTYVTGN